MPEKYDFQSEDEEEQAAEGKVPPAEAQQDKPSQEEEANKEEEEQKEESPKEEEEKKEESPKEDLKEQRLKQLRQEIYSNFRINIVLIEEQNTFVHFISNLITNIQ